MRGGNEGEQVVLLPASSTAVFNKAVCVFLQSHITCAGRVMEI